MTGFFIKCNTELKWVNNQQSPERCLDLWEVEGTKIFILAVSRKIKAKRKLKKDMISKIIGAGRVNSFPLERNQK